MQGLLDWLTSLPPAALYLALAATAAVENVFPPFPSDTVVAFGSFIAARGKASVLASFLATWGGNVAGAALMYWAGRRFGAERLAARLARDAGGSGAAARIGLWYGRRGIWALVASRFLPGVRALVPPVAGAMRVPAPLALGAMALASGVWYGAITYFAFTVGDRWDVLVARVGNANRVVGYAAGAVAVVALLVWLLRRRRPAAARGADR